MAEQQGDVDYGTGQWIPAPVTPTVKPRDIDTSKFDSLSLMPQDVTPAQAAQNQAVQQAYNASARYTPMITPRNITPVNAYADLMPQNVTPAQAINNESVQVAQQAAERKAQVTAIPAKQMATFNDAIKAVEENLGVAINNIKYNADTWYKALATGAYTADPMEQKKLKDIYDNEASQPAWFTALFGKTVLKDANGNYTQILQGDLPVTTIGKLPAIASGLKTATQGAKELGMTEGAFANFIRARVIDNTLTPERFKIMQSVIPATEKTSKTAISEAFEMLEIGRQRAAQLGNQAGKMTAVRAQARAQFGKVWRPNLTGESTPEALKTVLKPMALENAIKETAVITKPVIDTAKNIIAAKNTSEISKVAQLIDQAAFTASLAANTAKALKILKAVPASVQYQALSTTTQPIADAIINGAPMPEINSLAKAEVKAQAQLATSVIAINDIANQVIADNLIETQPGTGAKTKTGTKTAGETGPKINTQTIQKIQAEIDKAVNTQVNQLTNTKLKNQVKTYAKAITESAVKRSTQQKIATAGKAQTNIKRSVKNSKFEVVEPPLADIVITTDNGKSIRLNKKYDGVIGWKQGIMYIVKWKPYNKDNTYYSREPVPGIEYHSGPGSAAKSLVALYGEIPGPIRFDMGIQDVQIFNKGGKPVIDFDLDKSAARHKGSATRAQRPVASKITLGR